jgi:hypothetical protein
VYQVWQFGHFIYLHYSSSWTKDVIFFFSSLHIACLSI